MTRDNFDAIIQPLLARHPFRPFTVEIHGGSRVEVDSLGVTSYRPGYGRAVFLSPGGIPIFFDHDSVIRIIDAPAVDVDKSE